METLYRHILKEAWQIMIKRPSLWFFGLFAAFFAGANEYNIVLQTTNLYRPDTPGILASLLKVLKISNFWNQSLLKNIGKILINNPLALFKTLAIFLLLTAIFLFIVWLIVISQVALISAVQKINQGKTTNFNLNLKAGAKKFWPALLFNILLKAVLVIIITTVTTLTIKLMVWGNWGGILFLLAFVVAIVLMLILAFITKYALCYLSLQEKDIIDSLFSAFALFKNNWLVSLEMAFLAFLVSLVVGLLLALVIAFLVLPFLLLTYITVTLQFILGFWITIVLGLLIIFSTIFFVGAMLSTWQWSIWTLLFLRLTQGGGTSKLIRLSQALPSWWSNK